MVEEKDVAWHVGANKYYNDCRNSNSIGIEMCCKKDEKGQWYIEEETIKNTIALTKSLMQKYNIDVEHICRHYDVTRKICPEPFVRDESKWIKFKKELITRTKEEQIKLIQEKVGLDDNTIQYLQFYRYGDSLIEKIANSVQ